jgi:hypothetical protein
MSRDIVLYKVKRDWKRDLVVMAPAETECGRIEFPRDRDTLRIPKAEKNRPLRIRIGQAGLKGLVKGKWEYHTPADREGMRVLISGSGRCGTQAIADFLDGERYEDDAIVSAKHETLYEYILPKLVENDTESVAEMLRGMCHNLESAPYYSLCTRAIRAKTVVHLIRDGRRVVQSGINRGWYQSDNIWNRIKPEMGEDTFSNCCHLWRHSVENMQRCTPHVFRLEDLVRSGDTLRRFLRTIEVRSPRKAIPHANKGRSSSSFTGWTDADRECFTEICGETMDRYYPRWRQEW